MPALLPALPHAYRPRLPRGFLRVLTALLALGLLTAAGLGVLAAPASAAWSLYCTSYTRCAAAGYSSAGYATAGGTQYWRMYAGHNCTNYVAYRLVSSGLPNVRPWTGSGNATNWGSAMASRTDDAPRVGAVAWWRAYHNPAGSAGHVAYVERVISADEIVVSQDSWGGDFSWARITRTSGSWPSGFVHFNDAPLTATSPPTITGTAKVGSPLTAVPATFSPAATTTSYAWLADGAVIAGATSSTFAPTAAELGRQISVTTTGSSPGFPTRSATSGPTAAVAPARLTAAVRPAVTGVPRVGGVLTAAAGTWSPAPTALRYQWTADGRSLAGATAAALTLTPRLRGATIRVRVTATAAGYPDRTVRSLATGAVTRGRIVVGRAPAVTGRLTPGSPVSARPGRFTPADATVTSVWWRGGTALGSGESYTPTAAELGWRLTLRTTVTREGYPPLELSTRSDRVRAVSRLQLSARGLTHGTSHRVRLTATVTAPGVTAVTGRVRIVFRGRTLRTLRLRAGTATSVVTGLPRGSRVLRAQLLRTDTLSSAAAHRTVRVR